MITYIDAQHNIDGSMQDCSNSNVLAMELLQSCTKPSIRVHLHMLFSAKQHLNLVAYTELHIPQIKNIIN